MRCFPARPNLIPAVSGLQPVRKKFLLCPHV